MLRGTDANDRITAFTKVGSLCTAATWPWKIQILGLACGLDRAALFKAGSPDCPLVLGSPLSL